MDNNNLFFAINGVEIKGIRKGNYKEGTKYIRTNDSKRSKDGTGHMKLLATKHTITLTLNKIPSEMTSVIDDAVNSNVDEATLGYFSYKNNDICGKNETYYVSDYDWTDDGVYGGKKYAKTTIEWIQN